ncbi:hypothetical protein LguiA_017722 [Lonicera macranthoides]
MHIQATTVADLHIRDENRMEKLSESKLIAKDLVQCDGCKEHVVKGNWAEFAAPNPDSLTNIKQHILGINAGTLARPDRK